MCLTYPELFLESTSAGCFEQAKFQYTTSITTPLREFLQNIKEADTRPYRKRLPGKPPWKAAEPAGKFGGTAL